MAKLLAAVDSEAEGAHLRSLLRPVLFGPAALNLAVVSIEALPSAHDPAAVAAMIATTMFRAAHRSAFQGLRDAGYAGPILVIASLDSPAPLEDVRRSPNSHFLEHPYNTRDLLGLIYKFTNELAVQQRAHKRFPTEEPAEIHIDGTPVPTVIRNLSRGGAYIEIEKGPHPAQGSTVLMKVAQRKERKSFSVPAKIVWVSTVDRDGTLGCGVEFIATERAQALPDSSSA